MKTKLRLTIDKDIVALTRKYAAIRNTSVSKMVEDFLRKVIASSKMKIADKSFVERTAGMVKSENVHIEIARTFVFKKEI